MDNNARMMGPSLPLTTIRTQKPSDSHSRALNLRNTHAEAQSYEGNSNCVTEFAFLHIEIVD